MEALGESLQFRWLGVGGFELRVDDFALLVDPFFTRPSILRVLFGKATSDVDTVRRHVSRCDALLVTHPHYDHLMDAPVILAASQAIAYGSEAACRLLGVCGIAPERLVAIQPGNQLQIGPFCVRVFAGDHLRLPGFSYRALPDNLKIPLKIQDFRMDACFSFRLQTPQASLLIWHNPYPGKDAPQADILIASAEGEREYYETLVKRVRPRLVIPIHWDNLFRPLNKPLHPIKRISLRSFPFVRPIDWQELRRWIEIGHSGSRLLIPEILQTYTLE